MNAFNTVVKFLVDCGPFLYVSGSIMALGLAIALERWIFLNRARSDNRKAWEQLLPVLQKGQFKEAANLSQASESAIGKIMSNGLARLQSARRREDIDAAMGSQKLGHQNMNIQFGFQTSNSVEAQQAHPDITSSTG